MRSDGSPRSSSSRPSKSDRQLVGRIAYARRCSYGQTADRILDRTGPGPGLSAHLDIDGITCCRSLSSPSVVVIPGRCHSEDRGILTTTLDLERHLDPDDITCGPAICQSSDAESPRILQDCLEECIESVPISQVQRPQPARSPANNADHSGPREGPNPPPNRQNRIMLNTAGVDRFHTRWFKHLQP
jgi:hypothetical protein